MQLNNHLEIIRYSYKHFANIILGDIENAPFALVSHGTEADPIFNYGNKTALKLFEMSFDEFIKLPSRLSARDTEQSERARLLANVKEKGFSTEYKGIRISSTGRLFQIEDTVVCNLIDPISLKYIGQSAMINIWNYL